MSVGTIRRFGIVRSVDDAEWLGAVTCPSGSGVPLDLDGQWVDAQVVGPDAGAAARAFHGQPATMLYDIPRHAQNRYSGLFATLTADLDASLRILDEQVPHRDRVRRAIAAGDSGFTILGVPVITVGGVPADRPLTVFRSRTRLWVEIGTGPAVSARDLGAVGVDSGRLVFADADALPSRTAVVDVGDRFFPTRLDLDANGIPCALTLSIEAV